MFNRTRNSLTLACLLLGISLYAANSVTAAEAASVNIAEFNHILAAINQANIPDNIKDQLYRDMKTSMIENVRAAKIPDDVKRKLIKDLESSTRN